MATDKFWMVWVAGTEAPRKRHEVEADARIEAIRLAQQTHKEVYLLEAVARCQPVEPKIEWVVMGEVHVEPTTFSTII